MGQLAWEMVSSKGKGEDQYLGLSFDLSPHMYCDMYMPTLSKP